MGHDRALVHGEPASAALRCACVRVRELHRERRGETASYGHGMATGELELPAAIT